MLSVQVNAIEIRSIFKDHMCNLILAVSRFTEFGLFVNDLGNQFYLGIMNMSQREMRCLISVRTGQRSTLLSSIRENNL